jgi:hypothetical protein
MWTLCTASAVKELFTNSGSLTSTVLSAISGRLAKRPRQEVVTSYFPPRRTFSTFNFVTGKDRVGKRCLGFGSSRQVSMALREEPCSDFERSSKIFLSLPDEIVSEPLTASEQADVRTKISDRFNVVYGDAHGVAHLLDPRFAGFGMDETTKEQVEQFIIGWNGSENADDVVVELTTYVGLFAAMSGSHKMALLKKKIAVCDFWSGLSSFPLLHAIAEVVFNVASSSAAPEHNFSAYKFVHSFLRNILAPERVEKLVHVFFNAKNSSNDEPEFLGEFVPWQMKKKKLQGGNKADGWGTTSL